MCHSDALQPPGSLPSLAEPPRAEDSHYKYDMTDEEAIELGKRAIYHATHRDAYSGSINNVYIVKSTGWVKVHAGDVNDMHYKLAEDKAALAAAREQKAEAAT